MKKITLLQKHFSDRIESNFISEEVNYIFRSIKTNEENNNYQWSLIKDNILALESIYKSLIYINWSKKEKDEYINAQDLTTTATESTDDFVFLIESISKIRNQNQILSMHHKILNSQFTLNQLIMEIKRLEFTVYMNRNQSQSYY